MQYVLYYEVTTMLKSTHATVLFFKTVQQGYSCHLTITSSLMISLMKTGIV